jgi:hypothetical protein
MKYQRSARFLVDYQHLDDDDRDLFREAVRLINRAYEERGDQAFPRWPVSLRIKGVQGAPGVWG